MIELRESGPIRKLCRVLLVLFILAMGVGCGPGGAGDTSGGIPGGGGSGTAGGANASDAGTLVVVTGVINKQEDSSGDIKMLGELWNKGNAAVSWVKINFTFYDDAGEVIDSWGGYVYGSCMTDVDSDNEYVTCLKAGEVGAFEIWTYTDYEDVASYVYEITYDTSALVAPDARLEVQGDIITRPDSWDDIRFEGSVQNTGSQPLAYGAVHFTMKDAAGLVIDGAWSYIDGESVDYEGYSTSTGLAVYHTVSFSVTTWTEYDDVSSYYSKTWWYDNPADSARKGIGAIPSKSLYEIIENLEDPADKKALAFARRDYLERSYKLHKGDNPDSE